MKAQLLTRENFRNAVFQRDGYKCVICKSAAQDAHHIMERRLFPDGGYYISNGSSLCGDCHIKAEQTILTTEEIRRAAGITEIILPPHLYKDQKYTKWGDPILENGTRVKGELFDDESVQKIISPTIHLYTNRIKYPRTYHCAWSEGATSDDRIMPEETMNAWDWAVIILEKRDGENTNFYNDGLHARSIDYEAHPSRDRIKALHSQIAYQIPNNFRVCGENLTAVHSIKYTNLKSFFEVFSIWDGLTCLSWDDTIDYCKLLNLEIVPELYRGPWNIDIAKQLVKTLDTTKQEGYVIRPLGEFQLKHFKDVVAKFVRKNHIQTHGHWMRQRLEFNELVSE